MKFNSRRQQVATRTAAKSPEVVLFPKDLQRPERRQEWETGVYATFEQYLGEQNLRMTAQRKAILQCLLRAQQHLREEDVYAQVRAQGHGIGRATVFRTLKLLEQCDLAQRVEAADGIPRFELKYDRPHHDHLICVECGRITEFQSPLMEQHQNRAIRDHGFTALWHRHEIFGRCRNCAKPTPRKHK
jgi:Fur family transcriptional regulator, ferric uptake regulator